MQTKQKEMPLICSDAYVYAKRVYLLRAQAQLDNPGHVPRLQHSLQHQVKNKNISDAANHDCCGWQPTNSLDELLLRVDHVEQPLGVDLLASGEHHDLEQFRHGLQKGVQVRSLSHVHLKSVTEPSQRGGGLSPHAKESPAFRN